MRRRRFGGRRARATDVAKIVRNEVRKRAEAMGLDVDALVEKATNAVANKLADVVVAKVMEKIGGSK